MICLLLCLSFKMVLHTITNVKHRLSPYLPRGWHSFCVVVPKILKKHLKWFCPVSEMSIRVYGSWIPCVCIHNEAEHCSTRNMTNRKQKVKTNQGWDRTSKTCPYDPLLLAKPTINFQKEPSTCKQKFNTWYIEDMGQPCPAHLSPSANEMCPSSVIQLPVNFLDRFSGIACIWTDSSSLQLRL